jgi:diguanylate cyclase (GGDEF)-like protein/PAS domain S-box-containing protein
MLHPHDRMHAISQIQNDVAAGLPSDSEYRIVWPNGEVHHIRSLATMVVDSAGQPRRIIGTNWDVTEVRSLAAALRDEKEALVRSEARYRALTEAMPQMMWVIDASAQFEYVNARWTWYTGLSLERSRLVGFDEVVDPDDVATLRAHCGTQPAREFECEVRLRRHDDASRWHLVRGVPFHDASGDAGKWMITATDIEELKNAERALAETIAQLEHRAHHDPMTNLPNRTLLVDRLTEAMVRASRSQAPVFVLYVDLDRFKAINDSFGHATGDLVLQRTGERIVEILREGDTASRVGGDEFIIVCENIDGPAEIERIAARLLAAITTSTEIGAQRINVEASIGISAFPVDGSDADTLIRKADAAMYSAKQSGRNTFRRYSNEAHTSIVAAAAFEAELRHAIGAGELVVHYQPIMDLTSGRLTGAEALVRWQHPQRGLLSPVEFIGFAEERGLVAQIGDVVLHEACGMLARLRESDRAGLSIAVNVSAHQFGKSGFVKGIVAALALHRLDPQRLTIEITESVVMGNTRTTLATLGELRAFGVNLSIDDFGTGYSSLAYIKKFPITTLKIDRSFVNDIADDPTDQAIAKTIITLAHSLGMKVIAEGVETHEQLARLRSFGVDSIQGYLVSRPVEASAFERLVRSELRV